MTRWMRRTGSLTLIVALALTGAACGDRAHSLRERAEKAYASMTDYEVVAEIISGGERGDRVVVRQSMRKPDSYRLDTVEPEEIKGQMTIRNGRALWVYDPTTSELIVSGISTSNYDSNARIIMSDIMAGFTATETARYVRSERDAAGTLTVVEYPDAEQDGNLVRLWADARTGVPRRVEYLYHDGSIIQTVVFSELKLNTGLPDDRFNFAVPPGTHVINDDTAARTVSLEEARRTADFQILLPQQLPQGFELSDVSISGSGNDLYVTLSYTSGDRLIQLYECKYSGDAGSTPGAVTQVVNGVSYSVDAAEGFATVGWTRDGVSLSMTADTPLEELFSIAESLK